MNAWKPVEASWDAAGEEAASEDPGVRAAYRVVAPTGGVAGPLVFASPHSGRIYPPGLMAATRLDARAIRRSEDAHVDALIARAPEHGISLIAARMARAWLDVNREPWELDPAMFDDELPPYARVRTAKVAAGLGAIARIVGDGQEIYSGKLSFAEAVDRVETVHLPYHAALADLVARARQAWGAAVLVDWHSMPSAAGPAWDMVLGDRFGGACAPAVPRLVEEALRSMGYRVARNAPYAGGYTTQHYGRPQRKVHALQIEINRALYMDERTLDPTAGFATLKRDLGQLFASLAVVDWALI